MVGSGAWCATQRQQKGRQEDIRGAVDPRREVHTLSRYTVHGRAVDIVDGEVPRGRLTHQSQGDIRVCPCIRPIGLGASLHVEGGAAYPSLQEPIILASPACAVIGQIGYCSHWRGAAQEGSKDHNWRADVEGSCAEVCAVVCAMSSKC